MVIDDVDRPSRTHSNCKTDANKSTESSTYLAAPVDRLAAFMADLVIFLPLLTFALAPFKKEALLAQVAGDNQRLLIIGFFATLLVAALIIIYQTLFIAWFGSTPGKRFLGLRVVDIWTKQRPTYFASFTRSASWFLSLVGFGVPWLAIFSNSHRRPLHDRASDTIVTVIDKNRAATAPGLVETSTVSGLQAAVITFSVLVCTMFLQSNLLHNKDLAEAIISSEENSSASRCDSVSSAVGEWLGTEAEKPNRMEIALALHAGERIDDDCLDAETSMNFLEEKYTDLSYVAKAVMKKDDEEQFALYMDKVCGEGAEGSANCRLLEYLQKPEAKALTFDSTDPAFLKIWAIRLNLQNGFAKEALAQLGEPAPHMDLAYYYSLKRLQAKLEINPELDVRDDFLSSLDGLNREERVTLARETCLTETQLSCGEQRHSCSKLLEFANSFKVEQELLFDNPTSVLALSRAVRCSNDSGLQKKIAALVQLAPGRALIEGTKLLQAGNYKAASKYLKALSASSEIPELRAEAIALLASEAKKTTELESLAGEWSEVDRTIPSWRLIGWNLHQSFMRIKDYARAYEVGLQVRESGATSKELLKNLVVAAYEAGEVDNARELLAEVVLPAEEAVQNSRMPASVTTHSAFDKVAAALKVKYGVAP